MLRLRGWLMAVAVAVAVAVTGATVVHALWSATRPLPDVTLSSGNFSLEAFWQRQPDLIEMFPSDTDHGLVTVAHTGHARWQYRVEQEGTGPLAEHLHMQWFANDTCSGTGLAPGDTNGHVLEAGTHTTFCIVYTLDEEAPNDLQEASAAMSVTVTALQEQTS